MIRSTAAFECPVCVELCAAMGGIMLRNCLHDICKTCCKELIRSSDDPSKIKCPVFDCDSMVEEREIRGLLTPIQFNEYLERVLQSSVKQLPDAMHCRTVDCTGFFIVESGDLYFVCPNCDRKNCIPCKVNV